jgi:glycosyltransferase involved in cell wall biosynthesis
MGNINISIIIPFYNEREGIPVLLNYLQEYIQMLKGQQILIELIFVDDGSIDNSSEILQKSINKFNNIKIIKLSKNYGSHAAIKAGILYSKGEYTVFYPADMQYKLELITEMYEKCIKGFDVVFAKRKINKVGVVEKIFSTFFASLMRKYVDGDFQGLDMLMFNSKVRGIMNEHIEYSSTLVLQLMSYGFNKTFVECERVKRQYGKSKWSSSKKIYFIFYFW